MATAGNCIGVEEKSPKRHEKEAVSFTKEDAKHVSTRILIPCSDCVDSSSIDIIYKSTFEKMKLSINDLRPCSKVIYGFTGEGLSPTETIKLAVTAGDMPNHSTVITEFLVVDSSSAYNVVIGRPLLMALQAAVSIWCLTMKFPTSGGIGS